MALGGGGQAAHEAGTPPSAWWALHRWAAWQALVAAVEKSLTSDCADDSNSPKGVFMWGKCCVDSLSKHEKGGEASLHDKQLHMAARLLELGCNLMLSAGMSVSTI